MTDIDPAETQEWRDALAAVLEFEGEARTEFLLDQVLEEAQRLGSGCRSRPRRRTSTRSR